MAAITPGPCEKRSVLVVDAHPVAKEGVVRILEGTSDLAVCGYARETAGALRLICTCQPRILLTDLVLQAGSGFQLIHMVRVRHAGLPIAVFSQHSEPFFVQLAFAAGANAYVVKTDSPEALVAGLRTALEGKPYLSERLAHCCAFLEGKRAECCGFPLKCLTERELEVFGLIGRGHRPQQIARRMFVSVKTVETHREKIKAKLGLTSASELMQYAIAWAYGHQAQ